MYQRLLQKLFPKKFHKHWNILRKSKNSNLDEDLKFLTNSFIGSKSYKFVSNFSNTMETKNKFGKNIIASFLFDVFVVAYCFSFCIGF